MALRDELKRIRESSKQEKSESDTRNSLVDPILKGLGWDVKDTTQVKTEQNVGKNTGRVDYSLSHPKSKKCVYIEVKPQSRKLDRYVKQILDYGMHDGIKLCILTNGIEWWFYLPLYDKKGKQIKLNEKRFLELNIKNDSISINKLLNEFKTYLSFEQLADSYKVEQNASKVLEAKINTNELTKKFPEIWQKMLKKPSPELIELIEKSVKNNTRITPTKKQILHFLSMQTSTRTDLNPIPTGKDSVPMKNKPVAFTLFGVKHPVKYLKDVWEGVASELYKRHTRNFIQVVGKPNGKRRSYVELSKKSMHLPKQIENSKYWIETRVTEKELESRCHYLLEQFGYPKTELKIHF